MINKEIINTWDNIKDYDNEIISVFANKKNNSVVRKLKSIKDKQNKTIADFGCGVGNAFEYIKDFQKVYAVDISDNLLEQAKQKGYSNFEYINCNIASIKLKDKVDVIIAISSIFPLQYIDFDIVINNIRNNLKKDGEVVLTLGSLESETFKHQIEYEESLKKGMSEHEIQKQINNKTRYSNFSPLGYINTKDNLVQKKWLKEEIIYRLNKLNIFDINIQKFSLDWEVQGKQKELQYYPKLWLWKVHFKLN
jgi:trans-aconitate methyltransferase